MSSNAAFDEANFNSALDYYNYLYPEPIAVTYESNEVKDTTPTPFATDLSLSIDTVDGVDYLVLSGNQPDDDMTGLYLAAYNIRGPKDLIEIVWDTGSFENRIELSIKIFALIKAKSAEYLP